MIKIALRTFIVALAFSAAVMPASAQRLLLDLDFWTRFDNREYGDDRYSPSQTIFGSKIVPQVGLGWQDRHALIVGGDFTLDYGADRKRRDPELLLYYSFESEKLTIHTGVFQRDKVYGDYPLNFFSDSTKFYNANIEGVYVKYAGGRGYVEAALDWNSMLGNTQHEKFNIFSSGMLRFGRFGLGYHAMMFHHSSSREESGVVDNMLANPFAAYFQDWDAGRRKMSLKVRAGGMFAFQNDRKYDGKFRKPSGFQADVEFRWHTLGINDLIYAGGNLMPYYESYGPGLYMGDQFFRTRDNIYNRLEVFWEPVSSEMFYLRLSTVHHYDGHGWGSQQLVTFSIKLNRDTVRGYRHR